MPVNIQIMGLQRLMVMAKKKQKESKEGLKNLTQKAAAEIAKKAKKKVPKGFTKMLFKSGHVEKINDWTWKISFSATNAKGDPYGYWVEFGGGWYADQHPKPFLMPSYRETIPEYRKKLEKLFSGWL